ncbi:MAG: T9SS type A sorting domain-containing protein, partial [Bacteroidales bacterium]|nr:T9SS type A sorting domain-containing protein [Bacteroidales bacterium]
NFWVCSTGVTIKEFASNPEFYMYPNPASDYVFVVHVETIHVETIHELSLQQNTNVKIYNLTGKLVKSFPFSETEKGLNISDLPRGIYLVKVGKQTKKLVVE